MIRLLPVVLAVVATAAAAHELPRMIVDGDRVTLAEIREHSARTFDALAGEGADRVGRETFASHDVPIAGGGDPTALLAQAFDRMDLDGDGVLTRAEWNEALEKDLAFADENEDGAITMRELANARENIGVGDALGMIF